MTISIIVIPSVIHQGNDTRVPNVTFIPFGAQRQAQSGDPSHLHHHHPHFPSKRIDYTPTAFLLLLMSGRAMCYLTKNNNEGDGKCNLIPLIQLPLSPPVTGKQEAITVQRWHRFQNQREERDLCCLALRNTSRFIITPSRVSSTH